MNIGIIGSGSVATALQGLFQPAGHQVLLGSRSASTARGTVGVLEAAKWGEIVVLAIPFSSASHVLPTIASAVSGKIVIDAMNPLQADWSPLLLGQENSAGEEAQRLLPGATVVKAFNTVFADVMTMAGLARGGQPATAFIASDVPAAADTVATLARSSGFAPVKVGALSASRHLEAMAHLNIGIAIGQKGGTRAAFVYHQAA
jgi:8-hydroxy-5-deazaflavin:NADPH oxidoreductase